MVELVVMHSWLEGCFLLVYLFCPDSCKRSNESYGEGSISASGINKRWKNTIAGAIGEPNIWRGNAYASVFRAACLSYANRSELYPNASLREAGTRWVTGVKSAFSVVTPEIVDDSPFPGDGDIHLQGDRCAAIVKSAIAPAGENQTAIVLSAHSGAIEQLTQILTWMEQQGQREGVSQR